MQDISSTTFYTALRGPIRKLQTRLDQTQLEIATGRRADVGRDLGSGVADAFAMRNEARATDALVGGAKVAVIRMQASDTALKALSEIAQTFQNELIDARSGGDLASLRDSARTALSQAISALNTTAAGQSVFGGVNAGAQPIADYDSGATNPKQAVDAAFATAFGMTQSDPAVSTISGAAMQSFLGGAFAGLFDGAGWSGWSSASDESVVSLIGGGGQVVPTSVSANEQGVRDLLAGLTAIADLGVDGLGKDARDAALDFATSRSGSALKGIAGMAATNGRSLNRVNVAIEQLQARATEISARTDSLEGVDPAEASVRLNALSTQLQSAYALTSRINQLSLLNYL